MNKFEMNNASIFETMEMAQAYYEEIGKAYYEEIGKSALMAEPSKYAWNCVLYYVQFTQNELLSLREWLPIYELVKYQKSVTRSFLRTHFQNEIDESLEIGWSSVKLYVTKE